MTSSGQRFGSLTIESGKLSEESEDILGRLF